MKVKEYDFPEGLHFHSEHAWVKVVDKEKVLIGMNDFFQTSAGEIVYVDLPFEDDEVEKGETCGKIQSGKWVGKLVAPVSGTIIEVNGELEDEPSRINKSPYGEGWIAAIKPSNLEEDLNDLHSTGEEIEKWLEAELKKAEELKKK